MPVRSTLLWAGLVVLVALGVVLAVARVLAIADVAAPVTKARLAAAGALFPEYAEDFPGFEQHFATRSRLTTVHVIIGAVFLTLGLLQFSARIRKRHLRFHRRSGYLLVALAFSAGTTGVWLGIVDPYSSTERLPSAAAGAAFLFTPVVAVVAVRRGQIDRHREWMIRFFALGVGIVVIRLVLPLIILVLSPAPLGNILGLGLWVGWLLSAAVAEVWIRSTHAQHRLNASIAPIQA